VQPRQLLTSQRSKRPVNLDSLCLFVMRPTRVRSFCAVAYDSVSDRGSHSAAVRAGAPVPGGAVNEDAKK
jgi:hypothetical protein